MAFGGSQSGIDRPAGEPGGLHHTCLGGIPVSQSVVVSWIIMAALTLAAILLTRNLKPVPGRRQLVLEMFVGLINNFSRDIIGKEWRRFAPWLGTAALYITCANLIGLVGLVPPPRT